MKIVTEQKDKKFSPRLVIVALMVVLVVSILVSFALGRYPISIPELLTLFAHKMGLGTAEVNATQMAALFQIRLPRVVMACMVGCCLAMAGAAYQGVFHNPMASPDVLGASSGAAFGAALAILLNGTSSQITIGAFVLSIVSVGLAYMISVKARGGKVLTLVLAGMMVSSLFQAGTSYLKLVADPNNQLQEITYWLMGSLNGVTWKGVRTAVIPMAAGVIPLLLLRWRMNILTLGDDEAKAMGINASMTRMVVIICATLITAASISATGMIGWVGLVIPHMVRKLVGNNYQFMMPATAVLGAVFMLWVDNVSRNLMATEIPIGILTALIGAPFFMFLITRKEEVV